MYFGPSISVGRRGVSYGDSDAQAFISATGITGATEVNAINNLVASLKGYGIWSKMKAIYPFVSDQKNLLGYTEDFTNAYWVKQQSSILSDQIIAPDGTLTADKVVENTTLDTHRVYASNVSVDVNLFYTYSFYVKQAGRTAIMIRGIAGTDKYAYINISNGTLISGNITPTITSVGNGWYRCSITFQPTSASMSCYMFLSILDNPTYTGDGSSGVYIWGAQLEIGSTMTSYQKTSALASSVFVKQFKYNLKDPRDLDAAFRLAFNGTWAYSKQGATPNGANAYANTYLNPTTTFSDKPLGIGVYVNTLSSFVADKHPIGAYTGPSNYASIQINSSTLVPFNMYSASATSLTASPSARGHMFLTNNGTTTYAYINSQTNSGALNGTNRPNTNFSIGGLNVNGTTSNFVNNQFCGGYITDYLNATESANLYTSIQAFQTSLSRQV